jgi:hypothetical protein
MAFNATSNSYRTATGKKRKQIVTGAKDSALSALKATYGKAGPTAGPATQRTTTGSSLAGTSRPTTVSTNVYKAPTSIQLTAGQDRPGAVSPASVGGASVGTGGMTPKPGTWAETGVSGPNDITSKLTGTVGGYGIRPDAIPMLYQEPQALLRMTMQNMGMDPTKNAGMYNMALPNADLVNALSMIALGGRSADKGGYDQGENSQILNYMDSLFRQGLTRGGQGIDFSAGMKNILGATADSPMGEMFSADDPRGQYAAASSLMLPLAEAGLHPLFARAFQKQLENLRDEYYQTYASGAKPTGTFAGFAGGSLGR